MFLTALVLRAQFIRGLGYFAWRLNRELATCVQLRETVTVTFCTGDFELPRASPLAAPHAYRVGRSQVHVKLRTRTLSRNTSSPMG